MELTLKTYSANETINLAQKIAAFLNKGDVITLSGDLGAGKTTFVKGIAKYLNIKDDVISPTFNILKCYFESKPPLYHIDAYRLENINQDLGLDEFIEGDGICVIEWPIFIQKIIPEEHLSIVINNDGNDTRLIKISSIGNKYNHIVEELNN